MEIEEQTKRNECNSLFKNKKKEILLYKEHNKLIKKVSQNWAFILWDLIAFLAIFFKV